ncbi:MAG: alpha-L-fucosidase [Clostridia bacterium]|nr:alpha-L-fucosidase [Clostridia bacterium]
MTKLFSLPKSRRILIHSIVIALALLLLLVLSPKAHAENAKNSHAFDGVHFKRESITLKVGGSYPLSLRKINAGSEKEIYTSENEEIATVKDGEVFALAEGETTITVKKGKYSDSVKVRVTKNDPAMEEYEHTAELLRDFLDLRFGLFLHFNSATYEFANGGDWGGSNGENHTSAFDPAVWDPSQLDCEGWAKAAKSAGMTFAVLTTKHHDGFNLWDSAYTDYDVGSAKNTTDVVKAYTDACRAEGIQPGLYFSMLDIKHKITSQSCSANDIEFIKAQLTELLTGYGEIPFIIFDAWNAYWGGPNYTLLPYEEIVNLIHTLQPNCLVINISCEANNVHSQVTMFESGAGQGVPEWFDNVNISCNTPTSDWFFDKGTLSSIKSVDWVLKENISKFRDSDTVFILNASPNKKGKIDAAFTKLLSEVGKGYAKTADVEKMPDRYLADYDYHNNLLFHKDFASSGYDGKASPGRVADGYCDEDFEHETAYKSTSGMTYLTGDIGYKTSLGKLYVHISSDMTKTAADKTHVFLLNENPGRTSYNKLSNSEYVKTLKLTDGNLTDNCYTLDFEGAEGRYVVFVLEGSGSFSFSEIILNPYSLKDDAAHSLRDKFETVTTTVGKLPTLPEKAYFIAANGALVEKAITWNTENLALSQAGKTTLYGATDDGCEVTMPIRVMTEDLYIEVPSVSVTASSMWSQAEELGWAHSRNLIDKSGLDKNAASIFFSTHDNPYNGTSMWHTREGNKTGWLIFDLGKVSTVSNALIWNHNQENEPDRGVKTMTVYYTDKASPTDSDWIKIDTYTLTKAQSSADQTATDFISFGKIEARKIKFDITDNYGDPSVTGLSEVIFFAAPASGTLDYAAIYAAMTKLDMLSRFDYSESSYSAAKTAYTAAEKGVKTAKTQAELDSLAKALSDAITEMEKTYSKKNIQSLSFNLTMEAGKSLPETVTVKFTDRTTQEASVVWNMLPTDKVNTPGSFDLAGRLEGTPYTVTAYIKVEGVSDASLRTIVESYKTIELTAYSESTQSAFVSALQKATALLEKTDKTQEEVNAAKAELTAAKYALKKTYTNTPVVPPPTTNTPTTSDTPETSTTPETSQTPVTEETPNGAIPDKEPTSLGLIVAIVCGALLCFGLGIGATVFVMKKKG